MSRLVIEPAVASSVEGGGSFAERIFAFVERSHGRACAVLLLLGLVCFLPGLASLGPMDRDEPRFAQASKQMLETGDFVDIRFQDEARYKKPIGIHWLQSATVAAAGALGVSDSRTTIAFYRIPSLVGALLAILITYWAALAFLWRREAFLVAAFTGACVILSVEARLAKTDAVLLACSVGAMGALARTYLARHWGVLSRYVPIVFWLAIAAGILIKGPMVLMFAGLCAAVLSIRERSLAWLRPLRPALGCLFVLAVVAPWFLAIAWKSGGAFYEKAVGDDMLGKVVSGQQMHWGPPGFYLVAFFATFWPASILAAIAAPFAWTNRDDERVFFCLAWIVPSWIVFEAVPTKLPHYVLPLYPAVGVLAVLAMAAGYVSPARRGARAAALVLPLIPLALAGFLAYGAWTLGDALPLPGILLALAAAGIAYLAWRVFSDGEVPSAALTGVAAGAVLSVAVFGLVQPSLASLRLSPRLAAVVQNLDCPNPAVATLGYREPSLVFLVGTNLDMVEKAEEATAFLKASGCRVAFVDSRFADRFRQAAANDNLPLRDVATVSGFNINGGRRTTIDAFMAAR